MSRYNIWNPARDALLRQLVAEGTSRQLCLAPLNALPGLPVTKTAQVAARMRALGLALTIEQRRAIWTAAQAPGRTYTPERIVHLREAWPAGVPACEILAALNAMEGPAIRSEVALNNFANKIGLRRPPADREEARQRSLERKRAASVLYRRRKAAEEGRVLRRAKAAKVAPPMPAAPPAPVERGPEIADAVVTRRYQHARAALGRKAANPTDIARTHNLPLREVFRLAGELRRERAGAR